MTVKKHLDQTKNVVKAILRADYPTAVEDLTDAQVKGTSLQPRRMNGVFDRRYALELKAGKLNGDFNGLSIMRVMAGFNSENPLEIAPCRGGYFVLGESGDLVALQESVREQQKPSEITR